MSTNLPICSLVEYVQYVERVKYVEYVQKPTDAVFLKNLHTNINSAIDIDVVLRSLPVLKNLHTNINKVIDIDVALRSLPVLKNLRHATYWTDLGEVKCCALLSNNVATLILRSHF